MRKEGWQRLANSSKVTELEGSKTYIQIQKSLKGPECLQWIYHVQPLAMSDIA